MRLVFPKAFKAGDRLRAQDLNAIQDAIANIINGGIGNDNLSNNPNDRIAEAKIQFNANTGHRHNGSDSARVVLPPIILSLSGIVYDGLISAPMVLTENRPATSISVSSNSAVTADATVLLEQSTDGGATWTTAKSMVITSGTRATNDAFNATILSGTWLRLNISSTQGSSPNGITLHVWESLT